MRERDTGERMSDIESAKSRNTPNVSVDPVVLEHAAFMDAQEMRDRALAEQIQRDWESRRQIVEDMLYYFKFPTTPWIRREDDHLTKPVES
jgi:hypothetical protein